LLRWAEADRRDVLPRSLPFFGPTRRRSPQGCKVQTRSSVARAQWLPFGRGPREKQFGLSPNRHAFERLTLSKTALAKVPDQVADPGRALPLLRLRPCSHRVGRVRARCSTGQR